MIPTLWQNPMSAPFHATAGPTPCNGVGLQTTPLAREQRPAANRLRGAVHQYRRGEHRRTGRPLRQRDNNAYPGKRYYDDLMAGVDSGHRPGVTSTSPGCTCTAAPGAGVLTRLGGGAQPTAFAAASANCPVVKLAPLLRGHHRTGSAGYRNFRQLLPGMTHRSNTYRETRSPLMYVGNVKEPPPCSMTGRW